MKSRDTLAVFNRGRISRLALARRDVARVALSAETQTNMVPRTLGSMMLRPGLEYVGTCDGDGALIPFIFDNEDYAILELTPSSLFVWDDGDTLVTRNAVSATITNGGFDSDLTGWTDNDDAGGSASTWATGGYMQLIGTDYASARRTQAVTITETTTIHGLRIVVQRGPILFRIGSTSGAADVMDQIVLRTGTHSITFDPDSNATVYLEFSSALKYPVLLDSVTMEAAGTLELPTPWTDAATCKLVRWEQSYDVVFCACKDIKQRRIERRANNGWSVVEYDSNDGPFLTENTEKIRLTPSALDGEITVDASDKIFRAEHVGTLFSISSQGQTVEADISAEDTWTNAIRVTGVEEGRKFTYSVAGTWSGTVSLQRSIGAPGSWVDVLTFTSNTTVNWYDTLDNTIAYYRIGIDTGDYTSGTAEVSLEFSSGSIIGRCRCIGYNSETQIDAVVLEDMGGLAGSEVWSEGAWSDVSGWPEAVSIWEGRLWWSGGGRNWASVSDAFGSNDPEVEGDSGPINRLNGEGNTNRSHWMLPLQRLLVGTGGSENSILSTSFDEPVTPSNYNVKAPSTKGSAAVPAVAADGRGYFIGRTTTQIFELEYDATTYRFRPREASGLVPEIGDAGFCRMAVQQSPDMRLHVADCDGGVALMVRDPAEDVLCWVNIETDGEVEDIVVLPGLFEDQVFYRVKRTINGSTVRYLEKWAMESEARGGQLNKMADSFLTGTGAVDGLGHLEGEEVTVWADGEDRGTFTVTAGVADATSYTTWCAGLAYTGTYKSSKLAAQTDLGLSLTELSRIDSIGLVLADTHAQGLEYGPDFDTMDGLPEVEEGADVTSTDIWTSYDHGAIEFPGEWGPDSRICLRATAPRPVTVLAAVLSIDRQSSA